MRVVPATAEHVPAIAAIYDDAARNSVATFDLVGLPESRWHDALAQVDPRRGRELLVAVDGDGTVLGYAKSGEHKSRPAYDTTCETSVYVAVSGRGRGVGGALYDALLERLDASPLRLAVGGVAEPNEASTRLHLSRGYTRVGTFSGVGAKHGRAWDVTWYQRPLATPPLVREIEAGADPAEAITRHTGIAGTSVSADDGEIPIFDRGTGERIGAIALPRQPSPGERLLLEWCAEALAARRP
jgi:L-amino acid N-acyltransferase YncA